MEFAEYDSNRWKSIAAAGMATTAAGVLWRYPLAKSIAVMIGSLVSNPGSMKEAARTWADPTNGDGCLAFDGIKQELLSLKQHIHDKEWWKGPAWQVFSDSIDTFVDQLDAAKRYHEGVGSGMDLIGTLYHWAVEVAWLVANILTTIAAWQVLTYIFPPQAQLATQVATNGILTSLAQALRGLLGKQMKGVAVLSGLLLTVNLMCGTMTQLIDKNRPRPDYEPADLEYMAPEDDSGVGTLQPKNGGMPNVGSMSI
ncbi:hypothetical protein ACFLIM_09550 [Nonomuraea sp. M3C6]|uniref:Uncharacterized protein n=1 Tax=Nonomuraea marmarensis TaxID=3351344 RepID=A0ABW7A7W0_9ACTN